MQPLELLPHQALPVLNSRKREPHSRVLDELLLVRALNLEEFI